MHILISRPGKVYDDDDDDDDADDDYDDGFCTRCHVFAFACILCTRSHIDVCMFRVVCVERFHLIFSRWPDAQGTHTQRFAKHKQKRKKERK